MPATASVKHTRLDLGPSELKPNFTRWINEDKKEWPVIYTQYMRRDTTTDAYEEYPEMGTFVSVPLKDEGDYINLATISGFRTVRIQPDTHQLAFAITKEDREDNKINKVRRLTRELEASVRRTVEQIAVLPINLGFSATFPGSDGQPLFSDTHTDLAGNTVDNAAAVDLTQETLEAAYGAYRSMRDNSGNPIQLMPKYLVVHPLNEMNARRIVNSPMYFSQTGAFPNAAATGVPNELRRLGLEVVVNPYLTDADAWYLLPEKTQSPLVMMWRQQPDDRMFRDEWTDDFVYSIDFRVTSGFLTYIGAYGSTGA